jgi:hypothetical protein
VFNASPAAAAILNVQHASPVAMPIQMKHLVLAQHSLAEGARLRQVEALENNLAAVAMRELTMQTPVCE